MLLECLVREGVDCIFGYPGGVTLPLYDALYDHHIRHVLVRHEENAAFAAEGYARATGKVGVCCATSGPGATNLVTGLVDAMMDSIPIVAITGQVSTKLIGSDAFQEADTFGITRSCTKHNYLVKKMDDLPQIVHEAFYVAASGRPGPVLVDITKDVFQAQGHYTPVTLDPPARIQGVHRGPHRPDPPRRADDSGSRASLGLRGRRHHRRRRLAPNCANSSNCIDAPAVNTLMGLGALPSEHPNFISMPGMHGSYAANMAMTERDLMIALGVRFDDRVTGRLAAFAPHAKVIHVDIDPAEIGKNRTPDVPIVGDVKRVLEKLNKLLRGEPRPEREARTRRAPRLVARRSAHWKEEHPLRAVHLRHRNQAAASDGRNRPHFRRPRHRHIRRRPAPDVGRAADPLQRAAPLDQLRRSGIHGLRRARPPSARSSPGPTSWSSRSSAMAASRCPFRSSATIASHGLPIKIIVMNNGYLGMVRQWQDLFYNNRLSSVTLDCFPDAEKLAGAYGFKGRPSTSPGNWPPRWKKRCASPARTC